MSPLEILIATICLALKQGLPSVAGRVFFQIAAPKQIKDTPFVLVTFDGEQREARDKAPPTSRRTASIGVTIAYRGTTEEASFGALRLKSEIEALLNEYQYIPDPSDPEAPALIDEFSLDSVASIVLAGEGDKVYSGLKLYYQAEYFVEEASLGEAGPGIPDFNVLQAFLRAYSEWKPKRRGQTITAQDIVDFPEEEHDHDSNQEEPETPSSKP